MVHLFYQAVGARKLRITAITCEKQIHCLCTWREVLGTDSIGLIQEEFELVEMSFLLPQISNMDLSSLLVGHRGSSRKCGQ
jgi:hypothetical protein